MSLMNKRIIDLTDAERRQLYKPIGTSDLPYPATHFVLNSAGELEMDIGKIDQDDSAIPIYSDRDYDYVVGTLFRDMAMPSLMYMQKESLLRRALDSKRRLAVVLGDPGVGKSHMAKILARIRDSRGGWEMDCGGRYMGDLLFEQVIDFGEDFKSALTTRILAGSLSVPSVALLDEQAPGALIRDAIGKVTGIDWDKVAAPKPKDTQGTLESSKEAIDRSVALMESVAKYESIPMSAVNALGIRKQLGILPRAFIEGREVLLDEYNKSIEGSDDSLQTVLQFAAGEIDEVTIENTMKVNGREETYSFTFRREDMKPGFFITMTGNKEHDGVSTHALSRSAYSRVSPFIVESPVAADWRHRVSQILTGLPLTTIYGMFSEQAAADPDDFGRQMVELRLLGLSPEQKAAVPSYQLTLLKNWKQTYEAIEKLSDFYMYWARIIDPQSNLYDPGVSQNNSNIKNILPEISPTFRDEMAVDFRRVIEHLGEAMKAKPAVSKIETGSNLRLNFAAVSRAVPAPTDFADEVVISNLGTRLEAVLLEKIGNMTVNRPKLQQALVKEAYERGILSSVEDKATKTKKMETIGTLLNQDLYADLGGTKRVSAMRGMLERINKKNGSKQVITLDQAAEAMNEFKAITATVGKATPRKGNLVLVGDSLTQVFRRATAVDGVVNAASPISIPKTQDMVKTADFLASLAEPALRKYNMTHIWRDTISAEKLIDDKGPARPLVEIAENRHVSRLSITSLKMQGMDGKPVPVHILQDGERKKGLIVTDTIEDSIRSQLADTYTVVSYGDAKARKQVQDFIAESCALMSRRNSARTYEEYLTKAFSLRAADENNLKPLAEMMTTRDLPVEAPIYLIYN